MASSPSAKPAKTALITGVTGQDGSYLSELLLSKGYEVHGIVRRSSTFNTDRIDHIYRDVHSAGNFRLHYGDLADSSSLRRIIEETCPDEIYNLAAQSHVRVSFDQAEYTADIVGTGALRILEAVRDYMTHRKKEVRVYQASSSEMFGAAPPPQNEKTPFHPRSPYAVSKVAAYWFSINFRESYNMFVSNGILFNHESPRRGETFVTRKITRGLTRIALGLQDKLYMGNLAAKRDWGFAGDYVEGMWRMLQHDKADDFVIATGESHSVQDFLDIASHHLGLDPGKHVEIDPRYFRPAEVDYLMGDATKAKDELGWTPPTSFETLVKMMVDSDLALARKEKAASDG